VLSSFAREFSLGTVYAGARRVTVREYPEGAAEALRAAGFSPSMGDFVLYRSAV
jgi:hypothetical protein